MKRFMEINTPVGNMCLYEEGGMLAGLAFGNHIEGEPGDCFPLPQAKKQLEEYFALKRKEFNLPLTLLGTPFRTKVWEALLEIPYGETRSYGEIAAQIGAPKSARAVGGANHNNPISIIVPCHRVIGSGGEMTGYGGGLEIKQFLLELEKNT